MSSYEADSALRLAEIEKPSAVVLNFDVKARPGRELLQAFALRGQTGIIVLGSSRAEHDVLLAFELGAEDYLVRPCSFRELSARIKASVRRATKQPRSTSPPSPRDSVLRAGRLVLDGSSRRATYAECPLQLTPTEFKILEQMLIHSGQVVDTAVLLRRVWGLYRADQGGLVRTAMCRLRSKLRAASEYELIETRRGSGYILRAERAEDCG